jgi:hypothetical protein
MWPVPCGAPLAKTRSRCLSSVLLHMVGRTVLRVVHAASILLARVEDGGAGGRYQDYMLPKGWVDEDKTP